MLAPAYKGRKVANMSFAKTYNRNPRVFDVDVKGLEFEALGDLFNNNGKDRVYRITCAWISKKGKYGDHAVLGTPNFLVSLPSHMTDIITDMLKDDEAIDCIKKGAAGFRVYTYEANGRHCFNVEFVDL